MSTKERDFISKKEFKKRSPNAGYTLIGSVGKGLKGEKQSLRVDGRLRSVYGIKYNKLRFGVKGYLQVDGNSYVEVVYDRLLPFIGSIVVLGVLLGGYAYLQMDKGGPKIDPDSEKYEGPQANSEPADIGQTQIPGYDDIRMKADSDTAYVALWNPAGNKVFFQFRIVLKSNNERIYLSDLIKPGDAVKTVKFNQPFKKGVYPISLEIDAFDINNYKKRMNGAKLETNLVVLEEGKK